MSDLSERLEGVCETASRSGELNLMRDVLEWALRWGDQIPREARKELIDLTYGRIES